MAEKQPGTSRRPVDVRPEHVASEVAVAPSIIVIEKRTLFRDCLTRCIESISAFNVIATASVDDWLAQGSTAGAALVVLCTATRRYDEGTSRDVAALATVERPAPIVLLADFDTTEQIVAALDHGVRGYIPANMPLEVAIEAMRLVRAGGMFVPASSLVAAQKLVQSSDARQRPSNSVFTARQAAVVEALRRGKANKLIAYELNMCESTVKVHVRNIMKKLKAKNRTQVAFMANELLRSETV